MFNRFFLLYYITIILYHVKLIYHTPLNSEKINIVTYFLLHYAIRKLSLITFVQQVKCIKRELCHILNSILQGKAQTSILSILKLMTIKMSFT